jgi:LysM repeat protein
VQAGDTLTQIAAQYDVDVNALARANKITDLSQLALGEVLCIPGTPGAAPTN